MGRLPPRSSWAILRESILPSLARSPLAWVREPEPASCLEGYTLPENPTLGPKLRGFEPVYLWDRPRPIPSETMISISELQQTAAAILVLRDITAHSAAAAAERGRSDAQGATNGILRSGILHRRNAAHHSDHS